MTFILEIKFQKDIFYQNRTIFSKLCVHFEPLLGWQFACVCHKLRTKNDRIYVKNMKEASGIEVIFILET